MTFIQLMDCKTDRLDDLNKLMDNWVEQTKGKRTATHSIIGRDRENAGHYVEIIEFPSYEEAMRNSHLPETNKIFEEIVALCGEAPKFTNLDVIRDEQLNKMSARRFFEEMLNKGNLDMISELCADDYYGHDPANEGPTVGATGLVEEVTMYRKAFDFTFSVDDQLAEGDVVATRWSWQATHRGEFRGLAPTGKQVTMNGQTIFEYSDGKIKEAWWNWDNLGMYLQLGLIEFKR